MIKKKVRTIGSKINLEPKYTGYTVISSSPKPLRTTMISLNMTRQSAVEAVINRESKGHKCSLFRGDPRNNNIEYRSPAC